jgi:hypothetical protein
MINYYFPPIHVVGAIRSFHVYENSLRHFDDTHVITTSSRKYFKQDPTLEIDVANMYEVPAADLRNLLRIVSKNTSPQIAAKQKKNLLYAVVSRLLDSFPFNILIGDGGILYLLKAYALGKRLVKEHAITHLFSSFRPYSDHVVAWLLKRRYPYLTWIADFRDLHLDKKQGKQLFFWPLQLSFNHRIIGRADLVTTVSKGLAQQLQAFNANVRILPNGIPASPSGPIDGQTISKDLFYISYTGRIYPGEQDASLLFECISILIEEGKIDPEKIRLRYAGPTPGLWLEWGKKTRLEHIVENKGLVLLEQSRQIQRESAINLSLSFSSVSQKGDISSKIYEYLASRSPVLVIVNGEKDNELEHFITHLEAGKLTYHNREEMKKMGTFLLDIYNDWRNDMVALYPKNKRAYHKLLSSTIFDEFYQQLLHA